MEIKNSRIGDRTKVPHLSYVGDAEIGDDTNIGAGAITANFPHDPGQPKGRTTIGSNVRTGVHNAFVAPVEVGDGAWIAAGSVITKDVPADALGDRPAAPGEQGGICSPSARATELVLPGLEAAEPVTHRAPGHWLERGPQKRLMVFSGRSHPDARRPDRRAARRRARRDRARHVRERRDVLPLRRVDPRRRPLPRADGLRAGRPAT